MIYASQREIKQLIWKRFRIRYQATYVTYKVEKINKPKPGDAKKDFEKYIINKCINQPKLLFNYINSKDT